MMFCEPISDHLLNIQYISLEPCGSATLMSNLIMSPLQVHLKSPATKIFVQAYNKEIMVYITGLLADFLHKRPVMRKVFPWDDIIMIIVMI